MRAHATKSAVLALCASLTTAGCLGTFRAKAVQEIDNTDSVVHYPGQGGVILSASRRSNKGICIAPPAQSAAVYSTKRTTKGKASGSNGTIEVSAEGERSVDIAATLARLYEQNEQTLFVQHALYRLCEAYMNGLFDETPYSLWVVDELQDTSVRLAQAQGQASTMKDAQERVVGERKELARLKDEQIRVSNDLRTLALAPADEQAKSRAGRESLERLAVGTASDAEATRGRLAEATKEVEAARTAEALAAALKGVESGLEAAKKSAAQFEATVDDQLEKCGPPKEEKRGKKNETLAECQERLLSRMSRTSYLHAVRDVFETAERLSELDVDRTRARAELAKAEAAKAKQIAEAEKAKAKGAAAKAKTDKTAAAYKALVDSLTQASVSRAACTTNCKDDKVADAPKKGSSKGDAQNN